MELSGILAAEKKERSTQYETIDSPADKFRLEITKDTFEGEMEIYDRVSGPKFSSYWSDVYSIMEEDSFYSERSI